MKNIKLFVSLSVIVLLAACKKETTIKEEYNPPQPKLFGTWQQINTNPSNTTISYYIFPNDGANYAYILTLESDGFKSKQGYAYKATENQLNIFYYLYNYSVANDTLKLYTSPGVFTALKKVASPSFTPANWMNTYSTLKTLVPPRAMNSSSLKSFGIEGDNIYPCGYNGSAYNVYKFNTVSQQYTDSIQVSTTSSTFFKSPVLYYGLYGNNFIYKTTGIALPSSVVSNNTLNYTNSISANPSSGVIYANLSDGTLFSGTEGSTFNQLFDFNIHNLYNVLYYKNDEFLALKNNTIVRVKISPTYQILSVYENSPTFSIYVLSTNGADTWAYGYDNELSDYRLVKINLN